MEKGKTGDISIESSRIYGRAYFARNLYPKRTVDGAFYEIKNTELPISAPILYKLPILIRLVNDGVFIVL